MAGQNPWFSFKWGPLGKAGAAALANALAPGILDPGNLLLISGGGINWTQANAAAVIKATPGRFCRLTVLAAGTSGSWTFNDCATTGAAASGNQIATIAYNASGLVVGIPIVFDWPTQVGLVLSAVPGGSPIAAISWA